MNQSTDWRIAVIMLCLVILSGCNNKPAATPSTAAVNDSTRPPLGNYVPAAGRLVPENDLGQFAKMYLADAIGKPPRSLADMPDLRRDMPKAYAAFEDGRYVVAWGADPNRAPMALPGRCWLTKKPHPKKVALSCFLMAASAT